MGNTATGHIMVFDIGGTTLRGAAYAPETDDVSMLHVVPTPNRQRCPELSDRQLYAQLLDTIAAVGGRLAAVTSPAAVSIAFPGPVDRSGHVLAAPGIWGRNPDGPIDMAADLRTLWPDRPVCLNNDLTAAGARYLRVGDESFCLVTVSTGIGSKIFINGVPQLGPHGTGGEIGHARVLFAEDAPVCDCGERGHLQAISSGRGVLELIRRQAETDPEQFMRSRLGRRSGSADAVSNPAIAEAYRAGDPFTGEVIRQSLVPLAAMLVNLHLALGLQDFILIGGFARALGEPYRRQLAKEAAALCWDHRPDWPSMVRFGFPDDLSGLIGAGRLAAGIRALSE